MARRVMGYDVPEVIAARVHPSSRRSVSTLQRLDSMSRWHKLGLGLASSLIVLVAVELTLRLFNVGALAASADPFLDFFNDVPLLVRGTDADGQAIYTLNRMRASKFFPVSFPARK